jgi:hypothetical protein
MSDRPKRRVRSQLLLLAFVAVGVGWLGCASSEDDPVDGPLVTPSSTKTSPEPTTRPDFEAGFVEAETDGGNVDPTPDGGDTCVDNGDPGSSEISATKLNDTDDGVDTVTTTTGVLNGPVDVDFYKFGFADGFGGVIGTDIQNKTSGVEMCVFVKCKSGPTTMTCATGAKTTAPGTGTEGCCVTGPGTANPDWDCEGITDDDSADFFIRIKQTADKCTNYSFSYVF